jgi:hypothetical protein
LYQAVDVHGYLDDQPDENRFTATFILGLYQTLDHQAKLFQSAFLFIPKNLDAWAIERMNQVLKTIKEQQQACTPQRRATRLKEVASAVRKLEMGSRVFSLKQPPRWVAFGFGDGTEAPEWVKNGLLP